MFSIYQFVYFSTLPYGSEMYWWQKKKRDSLYEIVLCLRDGIRSSIICGECWSRVVAPLHQKKSKEVVQASDLILNTPICFLAHRIGRLSGRHNSLNKTQSRYSFCCLMSGFLSGSCYLWNPFSDNPKILNWALNINLLNTETHFCT